MIIDAHQHFWDPARGDYDWLAPGSPLFRRFAPGDLAPLLTEQGVGATIVVQAAPSAAETDYLLELADSTPWIAGVVGWVDLERTDVADAVKKRAASPLFVGIRPMLQDLEDREWILRPELSHGLNAIQETGLVFDALIRCDQLKVIGRLASKYPALTIMIDHAGKPPFGRDRTMSEWLSGLADIAQHPNTYCKLSGLLTEQPAGKEVGDLVVAIRNLVEIFGPDRLVWGSDWPVLTLAGDYAGWLNLCRTELERHTPSALDRVMGANARRVYKLAID